MKKNLFRKLFAFIPLLAISLTSCGFQGDYKDYLEGVKDKVTIVTEDRVNVDNIGPGQKYEEYNFTIVKYNLIEKTSEKKIFSGKPFDHFTFMRYESATDEKPVFAEEYKITQKTILDSADNNKWTDVCTTAYREINHSKFGDSEWHPLETEEPKTDLTQFVVENITNAEGKEEINIIESSISPLFQAHIEKFMTNLKDMHKDVVYYGDINNLKEQDTGLTAEDAYLDYYNYFATNKEIQYHTKEIEGMRYTVTAHLSYYKGLTLDSLVNMIKMRELVITDFKVQDSSSNTVLEATFN